MSQAIATTEDQDLVPDDVEWGEFSGNFLSSIALILITIVHVVKIYSDLCTEERKSVRRHRRVLPTKTRLYKTTQYTTWLCIFFYMVTVTINVYKNGINNYRDISKARAEAQCKLVYQIIMVPWTFAKSFLYCVYLLRLITTYGDTKYGYNPSFIYGLIGYQIVSALVAPIFIIYYADYLIYDVDELPNICIGHSHGGFYYYTAWDFLMNILCLILFMVPLRKVISDAADAGGNRDESRQKTLFKMQYIGAKITLLTVVACVSSVLMSLLFVTIQFAYLFPYDMVVNSVCIALMTIYYPNKYYECSCWLCLQCLPVVYRSESPDNEDKQDAEEQVFSKIESNTAKVFVSADTVDAVTYAAKQLHYQVDNSGAHGNDIELQVGVQLASTAHQAIPSQTVEQAEENAPINQ